MKRSAFTLVELMTATALSVILIGIATAAYVTIQRTTQEGSLQLQVAENGRAANERLAEDIRNATSIKDLPASAAAATDQLTLKNKNQTILYSRQGSELWRQVTEPGKGTSSLAVATDIADIQFWGTDALVQMNLTFQAPHSSPEIFHTTLARRN